MGLVMSNGSAGREILRARSYVPDPTGKILRNRWRRSTTRPPTTLPPSPARTHGRGHTTRRLEPGSVLLPGSDFQGPSNHVHTRQHSRRTEQAHQPLLPSPHTQSLSLIPHHRVCGARAAAAHRNVADATDTAIATVAVHNLRGTDGRPLSHTRSRRQTTDRLITTHSSLPLQRTQRARGARGTGAHHVVAVRRIALHSLHHSSGARQGRATWVGRLHATPAD